MRIKQIELKDFRNYETTKIVFDKNTNIIYGQNAQGKTNILEAIHVCATSRSHKGSREREMIRFGCDEAHIRLVVERRQSDRIIDIHLKKSGKKGVAIDKMPVRRTADLLGIINIIFFSPEDLNIIKEGPAMRRRFMDMELCQLDGIYLSDLNHYNHILSQRSSLLKDIYEHPDLRDTLDIWDEQMVMYGSRIIERRARFIRDLGPVIHRMHYDISGGREELVTSYEESVLASDFAKRLKDAREKDERLGQNTVGPHRDDVKFMLDGVDIRRYGSQGQQRTCALSLKLSEIYLVRETINDDPVLLLDDVLSELDSERQNLILENINSTQTIITCTGLDEFVKNRFEIDKVFNVTAGVVETRSF